ncbi:MAG: class I SAM-dependent methyltransferase [Proteobacteria bacterium]|nr:class I SAM-dependent methyltransferase [Pseudomonadota bacterium]
MNNIHPLSNDYCLIDQQAFNDVVQTQGLFFEKICLMDREKIASDLLNPIKAEKQADILGMYCDLRKKKVLEIGSGVGVNHIVWTKKYDIDGYGIEPSEEGFSSSYEISKHLIENNNLDSSRIIDAAGEALPFPSNSFDIVYSTNVLEHTSNPEQIIREAFRVLKNQGVMQFVYPNYHSYFDGHYAVFHPPILFRNFFPWYVKTVFGRDSSFAKTLRTELNIPWTRSLLKNLCTNHDLAVLTLGEEVFTDRMQSLDFEAWAGLKKLAKILNIIKLLKLNRILTSLVLSLNGHNPIILTVRKTSER